MILTTALAAKTDSSNKKDPIAICSATRQQRPPWKNVHPMENMQATENQIQPDQCLPVEI